MIDFEEEGEGRMICWDQVTPFTDAGKWESRFGEENDEFYLRDVGFEVDSSGEPSGQKIRLGGLASGE